jgi:hypothetical protein
MNILATARSSCRGLYSSVRSTRVFPRLSIGNYRRILPTRAQILSFKWLSTTSRLGRSWDVSSPAYIIEIWSLIHSDIDRLHSSIEPSKGVPSYRGPNPGAGSLIDGTGWEQGYIP